MAPLIIGGPDQKGSTFQQMEREGRVAADIRSDAG